MTEEFQTLTKRYQKRVDDALAQWLAGAGVAPRLAEAMRYSVFNGGKRIRPVLAYAAYYAVAKDQGGGGEQDVDIAAAALECIHAYSLIHDDLPAMDDDDLRRGKPTAHIQFDEATAILAGDALQTLSFEKLTLCSNAGLSVELLSELTSASGALGMIGGQMLDLLAEGQSETLALSDIESIHNRKTGALIRAAVRMGAKCACASGEQLNGLTRYAEAIGLAFQVQDDILDVSADTETLGKQQGADIEKDKSTYVSILGMDGAKKKAIELIESAQSALAETALNRCFLSELAEFIIRRGA